MNMVLFICGFISLIVFSCKGKSEKEIVLDYYKKGKFNGTVLIVKDGKPSEYGFGWFVSGHHAMHTGGVNGFRGVIWRDLNTNTCVIALTNQGDAFPVYQFLDAEKKVLERGN